jgi:hypothetical protein
MFIPIVCGTCELGRYRPAGSAFACTNCGHRLARSDFDLDGDEQLVLHDGVMHYRSGAPAAGRYTIEPAFRSQGPYLQATLLRAIRVGSVLNRAERLIAAELAEEGHLPEPGPWELSLLELITLRRALEWRRAASPVRDGQRDGIAEQVFAAHRLAICDLDR